MRRKAPASRTTAVVAQVRDVVETQDMSLEQLCTLLQVDVYDILGAFEDRIEQYADMFGVNVDLVEEGFVDEPNESDDGRFEDEATAEYERLLKEMDE